MAKPYTNPLGGRLNDLAYINKNSSGWNGSVNYRFNEINKLYIVIDAKLTNPSLGTFRRCKKYIILFRFINRRWCF